MAKQDSTASTTPEAPDAEAKDKVQREAYSAAMTRLREENLQRFNELRQEESQKRGVQWTPKPTKEERAQAEIRRLIEENPSLRDRYAPLLERPAED